MKIKNIYDSELDDSVCYEITIENEDDYDMLESIIVNGDIIKMKNLKNKIFVHNVEYENKIFKIYGFETQSFPESFDGFNINEMKSFILSGNCEFMLYRYMNFGPQSSRICSQIELYNENQKKKKVVSEVAIQNRCFEILNDYINHKQQLVIFGSKVFDSFKEGTLKVLMITYDVFKKQDDKMKGILSIEDHKFKETNIVIFDENSNYYDDILGYGGIIGVLSEI